MRDEDANGTLLLQWEKNCLNYPRLAVLAKTFLCCQTSLVPSERVFSFKGNLVYKRTCRYRHICISEQKHERTGESFFVFLRFGDRWDVGHVFFSFILAYIYEKIYSERKTAIVKHKTCDHGGQVFFKNFDTISHISCLLKSY